MKINQTSSRSRSQDRARVSDEKHEIDYTAQSVHTRGKRKQARKASVLIAKHKLGRSTSRRKVVSIAEAVVNTPTNRTRLKRSRRSRAVTG